MRTAALTNFSLRGHTVAALGSRPWFFAFLASANHGRDVLIQTREVVFVLAFLLRGTEIPHPRPSPGERVSPLCGTGEGSVELKSGMQLQFLCLYYLRITSVCVICASSRPL